MILFCKPVVRCPGWFCVWELVVVVETEDCLSESEAGGSTFLRAWNDDSLDVSHMAEHPLFNGKPTEDWYNLLVLRLRYVNIIQAFKKDPT